MLVVGTDDRDWERAARITADAIQSEEQARFLEFVEHPRKTYPHPVSHCQVCEWKAVCEQRWIYDDHLSLVANMRRFWIGTLGEAGITTRGQPAAKSAAFRSRRLRLSSCK